jgi:radical SAM superfamily enzyme YgiQ (UPF0313 family)
MHVTFVFDQILLLHQPLGPCYISAILKESGHKVTTVNIDESPDYVETIKKLNPDVLAYSVASSHLPRYLHVNREIRKAHNAFSLFGGPHPIFFPQMIEEEGVDAICTGEGEYPTLELIDALRDGRDFTSIPSMSFHVNGTIIRNPNRPFMTADELNGLPFPDRELIRSSLIWKQRTGYVMAGRGCPYDCTFCFNSLAKTKQAGRWTRLRSVDNVLAELRWLKDVYQILYVAFQDDTFILNRRWLREFLPRYKKEIALPFFCSVRGDLADEEKVQWLANAGCVRVAMGIESGSEEIRNRILKKGVSDKQILHACELFNRYGIKVCGHNIFGVPGETVETAFSTIELNLRCRVHVNLFYFFQPYPGTKLGEMAREYGFSGKLEDIPREYQDHLPTSMQLEDKELIEKIGQCAHLFVSYPLLYRISKIMFRMLPTQNWKRMYLNWLVEKKQELAICGKSGLPSLWHQPEFIDRAFIGTQPDIPIQPVAREIRTYSES